MQKKLKVNLLKSGSENDYITKLVANYNEEQSKAKISPRDLEGYLNTMNGVFPRIKDLKLVRREPEENIFSISEDGGKTFTMTIEWCEIYEMPATVDQEIESELSPANDLEGLNI